MALPAGDAMEHSESNGETSDADSVAESDDHHGDAISVGSAEIIWRIQFDPTQKRKFIIKYERKHYHLNI